MKRFALIISVIAILAACESADKKAGNPALKKQADTANFTTIKWIDSLKDIGIVEAGKKAEIQFRFLNTGNKPLYVVQVQPGCGCTVADYPKQPIMPGKEGIISANYNVSSDAQGEFKKNMRVTTNTKGETDTYIFFYGKIKNDKVADPQEKNSEH